MATAILDTWMTVMQTAHRLRVSPQRVRQWLSQQRLDYVQTPLGRLIDPESVERLQVERRGTGGDDAT